MEYRTPSGERHSARQRKGAARTIWMFPWQPPNAPRTRALKAFNKEVFENGGIYVAVRNEDDPAASCRSRGKTPRRRRHRPPLRRSRSIAAFDPDRGTLRSAENVTGNGPRADHQRRPSASPRRRPDRRATAVRHGRGSGHCATTSPALMEPQRRRNDDAPRCRPPVRPRTRGNNWSRRRRRGNPAGDVGDSQTSTACRYPTTRPPLKHRPEFAPSPPVAAPTDHCPAAARSCSGKTPA